jgi:glutaminyl-tRNA synthetase
VRLYDRLFKVPNPGKRTGNYLDDVNPSAKSTIWTFLEPGLKTAAAEDRFQFERHGYFVADRKLSAAGAPSFNRAVTLRDSWASNPK